MPQFLTTKYLKANAPMTQGVDDTQLTPHIQAAQDIYASQVLGSDLMDDLLTKTDAQTLNPIETELVVLVKKFLVYRTLECAIPFINVKISAQGSVVPTGDTFQPASQRQVDAMKNEAREKACFYEARSASYIRNNIGSFPLYNSSTNDINPVSQDKLRRSSAGFIFLPTNDVF